MEKARRIKENAYTVWKEKGETPLQVLKRFRIENNISKEEKMTYAGRLDPLAFGWLIVLIDGACHEKEEYMHKDKEYIVDVLLGISTDTGDCMGKILKNETKESVLQDIFDTENSTLENMLDKLKGKREQSYPMYSSKTVKGVPLWKYAKEKSDIEIPSHKITITNLEVVKKYKKDKIELHDEVIHIIDEVVGDFRQEELKEQWNKAPSDGEYVCLQIRVQCSSGTYMRVLSEEIGGVLGVPACACSIERTNIFL